MFIFGHLGIGSKLVSPWSRGLPRKWLLVGTLLPDLIDKSIYYGMAYSIGFERTSHLLISSTRTLGHTGIFLIVLSIFAYIRKSRILAALTLGVATHLFLDNVMDAILRNPTESAQIALLYPFLVPRFSQAETFGVVQHLESFINLKLIIAEVIGIVLLIWDQWKINHRPEIRGLFRTFFGRRLRARGRQIEMSAKNEIKSDL